MKQGRNELCRCGSGLKYKKCHFFIDQKKPVFSIDTAIELYAKSWDEYSNALEMESCYDWMASLLQPFAPQRVLDIGAGNGNGLKALVAKACAEQPTVVSLDDNPHCINFCESVVNTSPCATQSIRRISFHTHSSKNYVFALENKDFSIQPGINLVESDILLDDEKLFEALSQVGEFDAVTLWMVSTHKAKLNNMNISSLGIRNENDYTLHMQSKAFEIAGRILRAGGVLHLVDQTAAAKDERALHRLGDAYRNLATQTGLSFLRIDQFPFNESSIAHAAPMRNMLGSTTALPANFKGALTSVLFQK